MQFSSEIPPISFILSYFVLYYNIISLINIIFFQQKNDLEQSSKSFGADDRGRTGTGISSHGILSPGRLPVPPHRHTCQQHMKLYHTF